MLGAEGAGCRHLVRYDLPALGYASQFLEYVCVGLSKSSGQKDKMFDLAGREVESECGSCYKSLVEVSYGIQTRRPGPELTIPLLWSAFWSSIWP